MTLLVLFIAFLLFVIIYFCIFVDEASSSTRLIIWTTQLVPFPFYVNIVTNNAHMIKELHLKVVYKDICSWKAVQSLLLWIYGRCHRHPWYPSGMRIVEEWIVEIAATLRLVNANRPGNTDWRLHLLLLFFFLALEIDTIFNCIGTVNNLAANNIAHSYRLRPLRPGYLLLLLCRT